MNFKPSDFVTNAGTTFLIIEETAPGMYNLRTYVEGRFFDYLNVWLSDKALYPASDEAIAKFIAGMMLKND